MNVEEANLKAIAALIGTDPVLSGLVLRLVNSPMFGVRHRVTGVLQAVALLGLDRLRALSTTAALKMLVSTALYLPASTRCWRHSVACALATQEVAVSTGFDGDTAYTAGLLHDIGRFAMLSCWPREYSHLLATCCPADLREREFETLGVRHTDAGAFLLQHWGLPSDLVEAARDHHGPPLDGQPRLVELVSCGCHLADAIGFAVTAKPPDECAPDDTLSCLVTDQDAFSFRIADGINQIECL
jgi:putative nucleotidyltransferase with HDIG domain